MDRVEGGRLFAGGNKGLFIGLGLGLRVLTLWCVFNGQPVRERGLDRPAPGLGSSGWGHISYLCQSGTYESFTGRRC